MLKASGRIGNAIMWIFLVCFCAFSVIDKSITESSVLALLLIVLPVVGTFVVSILSHGGRIQRKSSIIFRYLFTLDIFCYISAIWAMNPKYALNKGNTLLIVLFALFIFDICLPKEDRVKYILRAIMWSGYVVVVFAVIRYGWVYITISLARNIRLDNTVLNANTLGMSAAFSILICIFFIIDEGLVLRNIISACLSILSIIVLTASGSRKAIFVIVIGLSILLLFKSIDKRHLMNTIVKVIISLIAIILILIFLSRLQVFQGIIERIQLMLDALLKTGSGDNSTLTRLRLILIGREIFKSNPFIGIGIDNAQIFTRTEFGIENYYLHNNYIELLADGGIIGFILYYWIYYFLIKQYWKNRNFQRGEFNICFTLIIVKLIMDYGMVTYETENNYIFIFMFVSLLNTFESRKKHVVPASSIYEST